MISIADHKRKSETSFAQLITCDQPVSYQEGWSWQQQLHKARVAGTAPDSLLLLEHLAIYTAGRRTEHTHIRQAEIERLRTGIAIETVNRGGSITYHAPGQLIGYPIIMLRRYASGPKAYVRLLEETLIEILNLWGVEGYRVDESPGVWVRAQGGESKIASIGVRVDRGVTLHGFALNVDLDLTPFSLITPCGLSGCRMTSLAELYGTPVSVMAVAEQTANIFASLFNIAWIDPHKDTTINDKSDSFPPAVHEGGQESHAIPART